MDYLVSFLKNLHHYTVEVAPYFILAVLITSFLSAYVNLSPVRRFLSRGKLSALFTASLGGILPVCSCSMVPVAHLINAFSKSYSPVIAFLIVAPVVSPVTVLLTYGLFGLKVVLFRVLGTLLVALLVAYAVDLLFKKGPSVPLLGGFGGDKVSFLTQVKENFLFTGRYLLVGIVVASMVEVFLPKELVGYVASSFLSYPILSFIAIPVYVCSGEDVPIAKSLTHVGFSDGAALTFMLASSGVCLPTLFAVRAFLPVKIVLFYALSWFFLSVSLGALLDWLR